MTAISGDFSPPPSGRDSGTVAADREPAASRAFDRLAQRGQRLAVIPHLGTYVGLLVVAVGTVLLVVAWGRVAGLTDVALQVPDVISAGFVGFGLVLVGLTAISIAATLADAAARSRQIAALHALIAELRRSLEEQT